MVKLTFIAFVAVVGFSSARADTKGAGSKGHVTAYEEDGKTVIDVSACPNSKYTDAPCGQTFRDRIKDQVCKAKGKGKHKWKYQVSDNKATDQYAQCDSGGGGGDAKPADKPATGGGAKWDNNGWQKLGSRTVSGKTLDTDTITVGAYKGKFSKLTMVVEDSDLELQEFTITFGSGADYKPVVRHNFKEGSRTRVIDLPGDDRIIKKITMKYKNTAGGGSARVEIWAK
jgi:hypothetical protein